MKKSSAIILGIVIFALLIIGFSKNTSEVKLDNTQKVSATEDNVVKYKDGTYEERYYDGAEGFYCNAKVTIESNKITNVDWNIYDKTNKLFDENYENMYDNVSYKQQCRDDLKGSKTYGPTFIEKQDIQKVDAISGATWTNNLFKGAIKNALDKAK